MKRINIWVTVGILQLIYGVILLCAGIRQFGQPPPTVLPSVHATFWAGVVFTATGLLFVLINRSSGEGR